MRGLSIFISISPISVWSSSKQFIVSLGIGLLVLVFGYVTDINFLQNKLRYSREQKIKTNQLLQKQIQVTQKIEIPQKPFTTSPQNSISDFGMVDILSNIEKALSTSRTELQLLEPQPVKEEEGFIVYSVKIEVYGQYKKLLEFINNVLKQSYFTMFEELILQKQPADDGSNELNMQVLLVVYKNKKPEENTIKNGVIKLSEHDVFTKTTGKTSVFLWSDRELHFLGLIKQNQNVYGFIGDPMGAIHRVVVGDKIGLKQSKIIAIDERGITTTDNKI